MQKVRRIRRTSFAIAAVAVIACSAIAMTSSNSTTAPATTAASHQLGDYLGNWTGKWGGQWAVRFTVTGNPASGEVSVLYEWEEDVGQPMRRQRRRGTLTDQGALRVPDLLEITLSDSDPAKATAVGHFKQPRTAELLRDRTPQPHRRR